MILAVRVAVATLWTAPDRPRPIDAPAIAVPSDIRSWTAALDTEHRLDLHGRVETQLLLGETAVVRRTDGDWSLVLARSQPSSKDAGGYPGWLPTSQLAAVPPPGQRAVVSAASTDLRDRPGGPVCIADVSMGTSLGLAGSDDHGYTPVRVPGRDEPAWIAGSDVCAVDSAHKATGQQVVETASMFLGLQYLWGGMCSLALDCSGLVHLVYRRLGVDLPRDAHDQATRGTEVPVDDARPGDLYFFAEPGRAIHHVGIAAADGRMLHAPESGRGIELVPMPDPRRRTLVAARRYVG